MEHKIESVMTAEVVTARPASSFRELVDLLERHRISALPVVDDAGKLVGIVSEADLLIKEGYPHGGDDAGMVDALRHRRRLGKAAGTCAADVIDDRRDVAGISLGLGRIADRAAREESYRAGRARSSTLAQGLRLVQRQAGDAFLLEVESTRIR